MPGLNSLAVQPLRVSRLGLQPYGEILQRMQDFTAKRDESTVDELWFLEHPPVYTQGTSCNELTLSPTDIPVIKTDRGGQITYHGPGQLIAYLLSDLRRRRLGVRELVHRLEQVVIDFLKEWDCHGERLEGAPGIYVGDRKIAALGLRVRRGCCYHGLSLNVDMNLAPFENINPCGFEGLRTAQLVDLEVDISLSQVQDHLLKQFVQVFSYTI